MRGWASAGGLRPTRAKHPPPESKGGPTLVTQAELETQKRGDIEVIAALKRAGSDLSKPHAIEHHFVCDSQDAATKIHAWGTSQGLSVTDIMNGEHEGKVYFFFDFVVPTIPSIENVFADTSRFYTLAAEHGASYDGWGCTVVK